MGLILVARTHLVTRHAVASRSKAYLLCTRCLATKVSPKIEPKDPTVAWFYATDIPKSKPDYFNWKPTKPASQYHVFSDEDSARLEAAYQRIKLEKRQLEQSILDSNLLDFDPDNDLVDPESLIPLSNPTSRPNPKSHPPVPVKEDGLFQVDLEKRELRPSYWDGPVYDVRRGTWFYSGSKPVPCPESLADELESLYQNELLRLNRVKELKSRLKINEKEGSALFETQSTSSKPLSKSKNQADLKEEQEKNSHLINFDQDEDIDIIKFSDETPTVVYGYKSLSTSMLQKIASSLGGTKKLVRGYKRKGTEDKKSILEPPSLTIDPSTTKSSSSLSPLSTAMANSTSSDTMAKLEDIFLPFSHKSSETKMEEQMKNDYDEDIENEKDHSSNVPVDHLVLCIHGIGQKLSQKVDSINFVHDINIFRKLTKSIQFGEASTKASSPITGDEDDGSSEEVKDGNKATRNARTTPTAAATSTSTTTPNPSSPTKVKSHPEALHSRNRIQVLPVLWRHDMTFGRKIHPDQKEFVTVQDINVEGVPAVRTLFSDVVADFLLYSEPAHRKQMLEIVTYQLNRIYREFCKRNPTFAKNPKVSVIAHSLGSVIGYESLRAAAKVEKERKKSPQSSSSANVRTSSSAKDSSLPPAPPSSTYLEFQVSNFITIGSPLGMFLLISGSSIQPEELNVGAMYNLFHPSDPISYRVEPLITQLSSKLKPVPIPYTKGGLTTQIQELSELGSKISQSASLMWSNITSTLTKPDILEQITKTDNEEAARAALAAAESSKERKDELETESESEPESSSLTPKQLAKIQERLQQLNPNGRIDYTLQEGVLDISILSAIASHVSYFENEDIANFVLQILYKNGKCK